MAVLSKQILDTSNLGPGKSGFNARYLQIDRDLHGPSASYLYSCPQHVLSFRKCSSPRCLTCPYADQSQITNSNNKVIFCKAYNVIYSLKCNLCTMEYIGQTSDFLHYRLNQHRSHIDNYNRSKYIKTHNIEYTHFQTHDFKNITIKILNIKQNKNERLLMESQYIKHFNTTYPYGLNQLVYKKPHAVYSELNKYDNYINLYSNLNLSNLHQTTRFSRGKHQSKKQHDNTTIKQTLVNLESEYNIKYNWLLIRKFIFKIKKKHVNQYYKIFHKSQFSSHFADIFYDILHYRATTLNIKLCTKPQHKNYNTQLIINFTNHVMNRINLQNVINNPNNPFPIKNIHIHKTFKYNLPLGRQIFNYNSFARQINSNVLPCYCNDQKYKKFIDTTHGHILTGDLDIIEHSHLKRLMHYGSKFRLPHKTSIKSILFKFIQNLDLFIYKIAIDYNKPIEYFHYWKLSVINNMKYELLHHKNAIKNVDFQIIKNQIIHLKNKFIITYVDKSPNNYAIICKTLYKNLLHNAVTSSNIFKKTTLKIGSNNNKILSFHKLLKIKCKNFNYPYLVIIPKFHKNPIKFRTVTIGCNAYNNAASKLLHNILSQIHNITVKNGNKHCLKNSFQLINQLQTIQHVTNIQTFDFNDLFNNIDIKDLHNTMYSLFKEFKSVLKLNNYMSMGLFRSLLNFTLYHNYIIHNDIIYQQIRGIPQGNAASSVLSDLYLFSYEKNFIIHNSDYVLFRYIDDIIVFYFNNSVSSIPFSYPTQLTLSQNDMLNNTINFLDLKIILKNNRLTFNIYDKRSDFPFHVNLFTHFKSCLHKSVFKNILINYLHRIRFLCSHSFKQMNIKFISNQAKMYGYPHLMVKSIMNSSK